ncbi:hypothetical protein [Microcoleus asticus]|uniref:hypothetical protein n=1 Tax=Microcoleus asticus TaxID=2815231 RepID=UPI001FE692E5|nr:hypothetical protein [Microcoleus asticus]
MHLPKVRASEAIPQGIAAVTENPDRYDVLISDIGMPDENGYFLIPEVRTLAAKAG